MNYCVFISINKRTRQPMILVTVLIVITIWTLLCVLYSNHYDREHEERRWPAMFSTNKQGVFGPTKPFWTDDPNDHRNAIRNPLLGDNYRLNNMGKAVLKRCLKNYDRFGQT